MIVQVLIHCYGCEDYNKHSRDDKNFKEFEQIKFESFSEAFDHKLENPDHYMIIEAFVNEDEE